MVEAPPNTTRQSVVIGGRYEVWQDDVVGSGGLAIVYRGMDLRLRRMIAAKTLHESYRSDPEARWRFRQEARMLSFGAHPGLVTVFEHIELDDVPWIMMELVPGPSLKAVIGSQGCLPLNEAFRILRDVARVMDHLHSRQIVHLDIKPQNIIMHPDGHPIVIDLGLAQTVADRQDTIGGSAFGSAAYLSPEQCRGGRVDARTDIYALGCVAYEMITGRVPFDAPQGPDQKDAILRQHLSGRVIPPSEARPDLDLPEYVDEVVLRALEKQPDRRYRSAGAFAAAALDQLDPVAHAEPATEVIPAIPHRERRVSIAWPRRRSSGTGIPDNDEIHDVDIHAPTSPQSPVSLRRRAWVAGGRFARRTRFIHGSLWRIVTLFAIANLLLAGILVASQGPAALADRFMAVVPGAQTTVIIDDLNVRSSPGLGSDVITTLRTGQEVTITGVSESDETGRWWPVRFALDGTTYEGWVWGEGLKANTWTGRLGFMQDAVDRFNSTRDTVASWWPF